MALVLRDAFRMKSKGQQHQAFSAGLFPRRGVRENRPTRRVYFGKFLSFTCVNKLFIDSLCLGALVGQEVAVNLHKYDIEFFYLKMKQTTV